MCEERGSEHEFEIGARFRRMMERRIERLEADAARDEAILWQLENADHIRRHLRLVTVQRHEASRIRRFLAQSGTREPESMITE